MTVQHKQKPIWAFRHFPITSRGGGDVRTLNLLRILGRIFSGEVTLYSLSNNEGERDTDGIREVYFQKPYGFSRLTGGQICMFPFLIGRALKRSELTSINPFMTVFETPYIGYAVLKTFEFSDAIKIYDSHNVEYRYSETYHTNRMMKSLLVRKVKSMEKYVIKRSDYIFATSKEEMSLFHQDYGVEMDKLLLIPTGVDTSLIRPLDDYSYKMHIRRKFGIPNSACAAFMGSGVAINVNAACWIINCLSVRLPEVTFVIIGSVCNKLGSERSNVKCIGYIPRDWKNLLLASCDLAVNPVLSGAGTNVKMLEYLAAGLPIVTTSIGARGLELENGKDLLIAMNRDDFPHMIREILVNDELRNKLGYNARQKAKLFDWNRIAEMVTHLSKVLPTAP